MKTLLISGFGFGLALAQAGESKVKMQDLPPAVQQAVKEHTKGATLVGLAKEVENGKTFYEAETKVNGKGRDILFDPAGTIVEVEEEVTLDSIPPGARDAIQKKAGKSRITKVEKLTKGGNVTYEAGTKKGFKTSEIQVNADGALVK